MGKMFGEVCAALFWAACTLQFGRFLKGDGFKVGDFVVAEEASRRSGCEGPGVTDLLCSEAKVPELADLAWR